MATSSILAAGLCLVALVATAGELAFVTIQRGTQSGISQPRQVAVDTEDGWHRLWRAHAPSDPAPPIDFSREIVVGVFAGLKPTAGHQVEVVSVDPDGGEIIVSYRLSRPPADALTAPVLTQPFHLVKLPRPGLPIRFRAL